jgi:AraC-like DNA-binding protein
MSVATQQPSIQRSEFSTRDQDEAVEFVSRMSLDHHPWFAGSRPDFQFNASTAATDAIGTDTCGCSMTYQADIDPLGGVLAVVVRSGVVMASRPGEEVRVPAGGACLYPVNSAFTTAVNDLGCVTLRLPLQQVSEVAAAAAGVDEGHLQFPSMMPISSAMTRFWRSTVRLINAEMMAPDSAMSSPLVARQMAAMAVAVLLETFPNTTMTLSYVPGSGTASPAAIRRAVEFIDANAEQPIGLTEIADAAGVAPRALRASFSGQHDTTPMGYLGRVRLERARRDLQSGSRQFGDTVAGTAQRWGFADRGRFAGAYQRMYGEQPAVTLGA